MVNRKPLYVVKKGLSGLGLFAEVDIKKDKKIIEYVGPILTDKECEKKGGKYLMRIDPDVNIYGSSRENIARYANHKCKPNAEALSVGKRVYVFAKKNIKAGEEIGYDYGKEYYDAYIKPYGCKCGSDKHRS